MREPAHVPVWMATVGMTVHVSPQHLYFVVHYHLSVDILNTHTAYLVYCIHCISVARGIMSY